MTLARLSCSVHYRCALATLFTPLCFFVSSTHTFLLLPPFFFNDTPTPEISPLPLHDALPIYAPRLGGGFVERLCGAARLRLRQKPRGLRERPRALNGRQLVAAREPQRVLGPLVAHGVLEDRKSTR